VQASDARPRIAGKRRVHLRSGLRGISRMLVLLRIRTEVGDDRSRLPLTIATEGEPQYVRAKLSE
jgi:hypothetical protein